MQFLYQELEQLRMYIKLITIKIEYKASPSMQIDSSITFKFIIIQYQY